MYAKPETSNTICIAPMFPAGVPPAAANGARLNARERALGVTGWNGAGASVLGEDPWLGGEEWRLKPDFLGEGCRVRVLSL